MRHRTAARALLSILVALLATRALADHHNTTADPDSRDSRDAWVLPDLMGGIYAEHCAVCHGDQLQGAAQGPSLLMEELLHGNDFADLIRAVDRGFPEKGMPGWSHVLSQDEVRGLALYVLEQRVENVGDAGLGIGEPPRIPSEPQSSELHRFRLRTIAEGIEHPYSIAPLPDGRILLTEKARGLSIVPAGGGERILVSGTPRVHTDGALRGQTYTGSGWMLDVALHPDYAENGWLYLSYGDRCGDCTAISRETGEPSTMLALVRGRIADGVWTEQQTIWRVGHEHYMPGHELGTGARIAFDGAGHVFLSLGSIDGYKGMQNLGKPYGKVHRVHDDGRMPADNPFVGDPEALPSVWTLGHRNPQGLDFDPHTDRLWESEHGPRGGDESNILLPGRNYGWPLVSLGVDYDGLPIRYAKKLGIEFDPADLTPPSIDWTPSPGISSIVFYRGAAFPRWQHHMLVASLQQNALYRVVTNRTGAEHTERLIDQLGRFRDVEVGPDGEIYLLVEHAAGSLIVRMEPVPDERTASRRSAPIP